MMFPQKSNLAVVFAPESFVDGKMPAQKTVVREVDINVCAACGTELEYSAPTYSCPECGETYTFKVYRGLG